MISAAIVGGSGYTGGELLRILLRHPEVNVEAVTSNKLAGKLVSKAHPNLRKVSQLRFSKTEELGEYDLIFTGVPHGVAMGLMPDMVKKAKKVIDLSADFRLKDPQQYGEWYGHEHSCPELLEKAVYGIPELHREEMKKADIIGGAGCLATSAILGMYPLFKAKVVDTEHVVVDSKIGSSASGASSSPGTHHPDRFCVVRSYKPSKHRHTAEMEQELAFGEKPTISFSPHAVEMVRGILSTCHLFLKESMNEKEIWGLYREAYSEEPFIRIVKEKDGVFRYPEPKLLIGSNYCDIGFERDTRNSRVVVMSAIDNMVKGASGQAVQAMNIAFGFDEKTGLEEFGFHPI
jgi:N-acetyl-gamma-glutamyl-phosphate/LysW-gamma-L-alpha-aminoadipyl-6-phosphate reductase